MQPSGGSQEPTVPRQNPEDAVWEIMEGPRSHDPDTKQAAILGGKGIWLGTAWRLDGGLAYGWSRVAGGG